MTSSQSKMANISLKKMIALNEIYTVHEMMTMIEMIDLNSER